MGKKGILFIRYDHKKILFHKMLKMHKMLVLAAAKFLAVIK